MRLDPMAAHRGDAGLRIVDHTGQTAMTAALEYQPGPAFTSAASPNYYVRTWFRLGEHQAQGDLIIAWFTDSTAVSTYGSRMDLHLMPFTDGGQVAVQGY